MRETSYVMYLRVMTSSATAPAALVLWISAYGGWDFTRSRGAMTKVVHVDDAVAARYIETHGHLVIEPDTDADGNPAIPEGWDLTLAALFPSCEHGMSASLCMGPDHFPSAAQERALWG